MSVKIDNTELRRRGCGCISEPQTLPAVSRQLFMRIQVKQAAAVNFFMTIGSSHLCPIGLRGVPRYATAPF
jgi:hypothetical protein